MYDRAMQALYALALQPIAETTADPRSFGFRLFRCAQDASQYAFLCLSQKGSNKWILEGDIRGCFDAISHDWLKNHIPMDQSILGQFLKAGFVFDQKLYPTDRGTPQGGLVSPILANMTLDGMEAALKERFPRTRIYLTRYADDFLVITPTKEIAEEAKETIREFLAPRGLELSSEKTLITHIEDGFDFLGWNFRKYRGKLLIKPSMKSITSIREKIKATIHQAQAWTQDELIRTLNPIIRGWANYHRHIVASDTFKMMDNYIWTVTWRWAKHRHTNKGKRWIARKYWHPEKSRKWVFKTKVNTLLQFSDTSIRRYTYPKLEANPYLDRNYFLERRERIKKQTPWVQTKFSFFASGRPVDGS